MKTQKSILQIAIFFLSNILWSQKGLTEFLKLTGPYLGQKTLDKKPLFLK